MGKIIFILVLAAALEQTFIMILEMFFIESKMAKKTFGTSPELLAKKEVKVMFANQGLYNGFLAFGLFWSLFSPDYMTKALQYFFLGCVIVAASFGAATANKKILIKQGGIAILTMVILITSSLI